MFLWVVPTANYTNQERNIFTFKTFVLVQITDILAGHS